MLVPDIGTEYVGEIVRGVGDALEHSGYDLLLYTTHRDPERERKRLFGLAAGGVADGLLTVLPKTIAYHLELLEQTRAPAEPNLVTSALPPGARGPENNVGTPVAPKQTANVRGPIPTNDWWSSLVFQRFPDNP